MAASTLQNPAVASESKSAKKKKAKVERTESPAPAATLTPEKAASVTGNDGNQDESSDSPYIRELQKNIRNINKKIANASKTDTVIAEHPGKSLDDLIQLKIINTDQKTQHLKKPALQAQVVQIEEQLVQYKKVDNEYRARAVAEKAELEKSLSEKYEKEKAEAVAEAKDTAATETQKGLREGLLVVSQFLRLAAARRAEDANAELDENLALEGVLLHIYSGDENGVATMLNIVQGSNEPARNVSGQPLSTTYAQVKALAVAHSAPLFQTEAGATGQDNNPKDVPRSDPTIVHAGLTEIDDGTSVPFTNGHTEDSSPTGAVPANADSGEAAANAAGESQWDTPTNDMTMSQEWVDVTIPREASELGTGASAGAGAAEPSVPAPAGNLSSSWADDQPENNSQPQAPPAGTDDGFHQVQRQHRTRGDREGGWRGGRGGERGGYRGRGGFRGDGQGRGRGRGGPRGGMGMRGPRREES